MDRAEDDLVHLRSASRSLEQPSRKLSADVRAEIGRAVRRRRITAGLALAAFAGGWFGLRSLAPRRAQPVPRAIHIDDLASTMKPTPAPDPSAVAVAKTVDVAPRTIDRSERGIRTIRANPPTALASATISGPNGPVEILHGGGLVAVRRPVKRPGIRLYEAVSVPADGRSIRLPPIQPGKRKGGMS
jgi:hypothetical protein